MTDRRPRAKAAKEASSARGARARKTGTARGDAVGVSYPEVIRLGRAFAGVEESTSYGTPALKVGGVLMTRLWEDGETLVLRTTFVDRDLLMQADPDVYFLTDHYRNYPCVLVRLPRIQREELRERLEEAWGRAQAARPGKRRSKVARAEEDRDRRDE